MNINFEDITQNYNDIIPYIVMSCDRFSVISNAKRPCSRASLAFEHQETMHLFEPYILDYVTNIRKWPGTETKAKHKVMVIYELCKASRKVFNDFPNVFLPIQNGLPEDITFYRNGSAWLITISHEKMAFVSNLTEDDRAFFQKQHIRLYD